MKIILINKNESSFLNTIKSRCMILRFNNISNDEIKKYLKDSLIIDNVTEKDLDIFQGSIKKAIEFKNKKYQYETIDQILENIQKNDIIDIVNQSELLYKSKNEINEILDYINMIFIKKAKKDIIYTNCIQIVENTKKRIKQNSNYDMCIDNMLFGIWEEFN